MTEPDSVFQPIISKSELPPLTQQQEQIMREQRIDEKEPGTILHDFEVILYFLNPNGVEVSSVNGVLSGKSLKEINRRLSNPLQIGLRRGHQKSYPYIHGLYLLLRCSRIAKITTLANKAVLVLDKAVLESWNRLNPTERYCTLLESWFVWGSEEILGRQSRRASADSILVKCWDFRSKLPSTGKAFANYAQQQNLIYIPGLHNLALLELFGFISVEHGTPQLRKGWRINKVEPLPYGTAMLIFLYGIFKRHNFFQDCHGYEDIVFGQLQGYLKPFFSEWEQSLVVPKRADSQNKLYTFKVFLGKIWRRIVIPSRLELDSLASTILESFNFDASHLYLFAYKNRWGRTTYIHHPYLQKSPFTDRFLVGDLPLKPEGGMTFIYDFDKRWEFNLKLEQIDGIELSMNKPRLLEGKGDPPPQYWYGSGT